MPDFKYVHFKLVPHGGRLAVCCTKITFCGVLIHERLVANALQLI
jgi:hypothetical protein